MPIYIYGRLGMPCWHVVKGYGAIMQPISAIKTFDYMSAASISYAFSKNNAKLTASTKARLNALGIETQFIKTEREGLAELHKVETERARGLNKARKAKKAHNANSVANGIMDVLRKLANDLGITLDPNDTIDQHIYRLANKIGELKAQAENNPSKTAVVVDYIDRLEYAKTLQKSAFDLAASMSASANMNIAFHNL